MIIRAAYVYIFQCLVVLNCSASSGSVEIRKAKAKLYEKADQYCKAFEVYRDICPSPDCGHADVLVELSSYYNGLERCTESDNARSIEYLKAAAEKGDPYAQVSLSQFYQYGFFPETPKDLKKALSLLESAAAQKSCLGLLSLAFSQEKGTLGKKDIDTAVQNYCTALERGCLDAYEDLIRLGEDPMECLPYGLPFEVIDKALSELTEEIEAEADE